jgi:nicotinamidase-related amidase
MNRKALIVIDAQHSFRHSPYWSENDLPDYLANQQALIDGCVQQGIERVIDQSAVGHP